MHFMNLACITCMLIFRNTILLPKNYVKNVGSGRNASIKAEPTAMESLGISMFMELLIHRLSKGIRLRRIKYLIASHHCYQIFRI